MVHALHEAHRVLRPRGILVDARPDSRVLAYVEHQTPRGYRVIGRLATARDTLVDDRASDRALASVMDEGMFRSLKARTFWHRVHFDDLRSLQDYLNDHLRFVHRARWTIAAAERQRHRDDAFVIRRAVRYELLARSGETK